MCQRMLVVKKQTLLSSKFFEHFYERLSSFNFFFANFYQVSNFFFELLSNFIFFANFYQISIFFLNFHQVSNFFITDQTGKTTAIRREKIRGRLESKYFRNLIKSNQNQIVFTMHRLIWYQTDASGCVPNQSENGKYNLISV